MTGYTLPPMKLQSGLASGAFAEIRKSANNRSHGLSVKDPSIGEEYDLYIEGDAHHPVIRYSYLNNDTRTTDFFELYNNKTNKSKVVTDNKQELINLIYPVGSIYMSVNSTNPASLFGGTWEQMEDRFLLGAGSTYSAGSTGGAATVSLTIDQIPAHTHEVHSRSVYSGGGSYIGFCNEANSTKSYVTGSRGGGEAHNNMPPYLVVYIWKRTA